ncbi:hypothetical protein CRG98_050426 [Punica granatum]|uniref:Uncharacterized protein n=1 Tax=Punica granatum TaxID=22663 RepID=A0A2I0GBT3_PUNGR|nr:hypothetical protein CRG98_050426 [Punica granatum]
MAVGATTAIQRLLTFYVEEAREAEISKAPPELKWEDLQETKGKVEYLEAEIQDPSEKVLGTEENPRITYVSQLLDNDRKLRIIDTLHKFKDCFTWEYSEMPVLSRDFVEHRLPIKPEYRPFKQHLKWIRNK